MDDKCKHAFSVFGTYVTVSCDDIDVAVIVEDGKLKIMAGDEYGEHGEEIINVNINYCPNCGSKFVV